MPSSPSHSHADREQARLAAAFALPKRHAPSFIANEVATRIADKLAFISLPVNSVNLHLLPSDEASIPALYARYPSAMTPHLQGNAALQTQQTKWWQKLWKNADTQNSNRLSASNIAGKLIYTQGRWGNQTDLLWSNVIAASQPEPLALAQQWMDALKTGGFVMFSSFGPDTARELVQVLRDVEGMNVNTHSLVDMHDWGDALVQAGFSDPVMDMEKITLTYREPLQALRELAAILPMRPLHAGLRTPAQRHRLLAALDASRNEQGLIVMTLEVIYGHAFKVQPKDNTATSLEDLKATLPSRKRGVQN